MLRLVNRIRANTKRRWFKIYARGPPLAKSFKKIRFKQKEENMKLCQVLAIDSGIRNKSKSELTTLHRAAEKSELYAGLNRTYRPRDEEGEKFPDERQHASLKSKEVLAKLQDIMSEALDIELTKDVGNCSAKADIVVDGETVLKDVPVSYLLFLEKQLDDVFTFVNKMPILDPSEIWTFDPGQNLYRSEPVETTKTKKRMTPVVLYEATKEHPAQVKEVTEDIVVGSWSATKFSGALTADRKELLVSRIQKLQKAVKFAREEANSIEVTKKSASSALFGFILK